MILATILMLVVGTGAFLGLPAFRETMAFQLDSIIGGNDGEGGPVHADQLADGSPTPRSTVEANRQNATPVGSPASSTVRSCDDAEEYAQAIVAWHASLEVDLTAVVPGGESGGGRMLTSEELSESSEITRAALADFDNIEPTEASQDFHIAYRRFVVLQGDSFAIMAQEGLFAALVYGEEIETTEARVGELAVAFEEMCSVALYDNDHDPDEMPEIGWGEPTLGPTATAQATRIPAPTPAPVNDGLGTRDNPVPLGTAFVVGNGWSIQVWAVDWDTADVVARENLNNDPPAPGQSFVMVAVAATYIGEPDDALDETSNLWSAITFKAVGANAVAYNQSDPGCGVIPSDTTDAPEVFAGGTVRANVCWSVPDEDLDSLVMFTSATWDLEYTLVFFALR